MVSHTSSTYLLVAFNNIDHTVLINSLHHTARLNSKAKHFSFKQTQHSSNLIYFSSLFETLPVILEHPEVH